MRLLLFSLLIAFSGISSAQSSAPKSYTGYGLDRRYPGGEMAMIKFLHTNLHYPDSALAYDIQGRVMVRLKILSNGAVDSVHVTSHPNPYLDGEAVRVFKLLHFSPATDTTLDLYMELPIDFRF